MVVALHDEGEGSCETPFFLARSISIAAVRADDETDEIRLIIDSPPS